MKIIWKRLGGAGEDWRQVYKALNLLEYLTRSGSDRVVDECRDHMYQLRALQDFRYTDDSGSDQGINVRQKSKTLCELVNDDARLDEERQIAAKNCILYTSPSPRDRTRYSMPSSS
eukprot:TRINITY_DN17134_c0_g1_i1.p1 TRINITY_DN17134_c0_g1~~TRINITY_DN17134_c0_g1_i1.p1  ORF type:complete len:116 (-),score=35.23 TRINITY_DN17134_c0_g1_i1:31-378(-)